MEKEIENIKDAIRFMANTLAYSEARSNKANERIEGQFMRQVEMFNESIERILNKK